ncbi:MAG: hypothetical protein Q7S05_02500 [bacterium]|nr:hypothetical protein [bacterium]
MNRNLANVASTACPKTLAQAAKAAGVKEGGLFFLVFQENRIEEWQRSYLWVIRVIKDEFVIRIEEKINNRQGGHVADTIRNRIAGFLAKPPPQGRFRGFVHDLRTLPPPIFLVKHLPTGTCQLVLVGYDQQPLLKKGKKVVIEVDLASIEST